MPNKQTQTAVHCRPRLVRNAGPGQQPHFWSRKFVERNDFMDCLVCGFVEHQLLLIDRHIRVIPVRLSILTCERMYLHELAHLTHDKLSYNLMIPFHVQYMLNYGY